MSYCHILASLYKHSSRRPIEWHIVVLKSIYDGWKYGPYPFKDCFTYGYDDGRTVEKFGMDTMFDKRGYQGSIHLGTIAARDVSQLKDYLRSRIGMPDFYAYKGQISQRWVCQAVEQMRSWPFVQLVAEIKNTSGQRLYDLLGGKLADAQTRYAADRMDDTTAVLFPAEHEEARRGYREWLADTGYKTAEGVYNEALQRQRGLGNR